MIPGGALSALYDPIVRITPANEVNPGSPIPRWRSLVTVRSMVHQCGSSHRQACSHKGFAILEPNGKHPWTTDDTPKAKQLTFVTVIGASAQQKELCSLPGPQHAGVLVTLVLLRTN